jgi:hypothetical protein
VGSEGEAIAGNGRAQLGDGGSMRVIQEGNRRKVERAKLEVLKARALTWSKVCRCSECGAVVEVRAEDIKHDAWFSILSMNGGEHYQARCGCGEWLSLSWLPRWIKKLARSGVAYRGAA